MQNSENEKSSSLIKFVTEPINNKTKDDGDSGVFNCNQVLEIIKNIEEETQGLDSVKQNNRLNPSIAKMNRNAQNDSNSNNIINMDCVSINNTNNNIKNNQNVDVSSMNNNIAKKKKLKFSERFQDDEEQFNQY